MLDELLITLHPDLLGNLGLWGRLDALGPVLMEDQAHLQLYLVLNLVEIRIRARAGKAY